MKTQKSLRVYPGSLFDEKTLCDVVRSELIPRLTARETYRFINGDMPLNISVSPRVASEHAWGLVRLRKALGNVRVVPSTDGVQTITISLGRHRVGVVTEAESDTYWCSVVD